MLLNTVGQTVCVTCAAGSQRILLAKHQAIFEGPQEHHTLSCIDGVWTCDCTAYRAFRDLPGGGWCPHTVALKHMLDTLTNGILPEYHAQLQQGVT